MKILVVGGVAGGATAIARLRRLNEDAEIILFERGKYVSFANCGLPYYIGEVISNREALLVSTPEDIHGKYNVDIRIENEVVKIHPEEKFVEVKDLQTGETYQETYDKLLLSTGSRPFVPPVEGLDADNIFTLWTIPDVDEIDQFIRDKNPKRAVVVGGGFIGLEMAENLVERGLKVSIVEMSNQVMPPLDKDMAKIVENHLRQKGVDLRLGEGFQGTKDDGRTVLLSSGDEIQADLVLLSVGVRPNSQLAADAGLELNERKGIKVDAYNQTSDPDIYAVGDVVGVQDFVLGGETMVPLAGPANKQGRSVGANMLYGEKESYEGTMGTSVAKIFDLSVASVGASEKALGKKEKEYGKDYLVTIIHPSSHAGYYPGALPMTIKLIFGLDRKILGAQIIGYDGVDKRIDTIATSIHFHGSVDDLSHLELAYAPPYSSAKDPVNFAGYTAVNILDGLSDPVLYRGYKENPDHYQLIDVREEIETVAGSLEGALQIPLTQLRDRYEELDKDQSYLVFCAVGLRGYVAERILKQKGYQVSNLVGGYRTAMDWEEDATLSGEMDTGQEKIISSANVDTQGPSENLGDKADQDPSTSHVEILDVCGMSCPGPIVQVAQAMEDLEDGDILEVTATDPGFTRDIESWCKNTGNTLLSRSEDKGKFFARLQKGQGQNPAGQVDQASQDAGNAAEKPKEKTMIIFDGDLDKAIAAFIIATGAAAMGNKVHMFFTFWGLSILRKNPGPDVDKDFMGKMFGTMLPKGSEKLGLSRMNFGGAGAKMIRGVMDKKGIDSLEDLIQQALDMGVELTACQMTMDIMGLSQDELLDGVQIGGVATMLNDSDNSNMNLFI